MNAIATTGLTYDEVVMGRRSIRGFKKQPVPKAWTRRRCSSASTTS